MKFVLGLVLITLSIVAQADDEAKIQVQGNCEIKVVPDRGMITFTAENQFKDQKSAVNKTTEQINKLKVEIKALNLKELELKDSDYSVYPVREYEKERYVDKGFRASSTLTVKSSEIARLGETMLVASKIGITSVGTLQTYLSIEKSQSEYLKCLDIAAIDAKNKAVALGKKLDFNVGDVLFVSESPQVDNSPRPMMMKSFSPRGGVPNQVEAGTQNFSTNIQVTFEIK